MDTKGLYNYLIWRGDLPIAADGFHDADNIILCELSYVDYAPVFNDEAITEMTLRECGERIHECNAYSLKTLTGGNEEFFQLVCASERFGTLTVRNYTEKYEEERNLQFSAVEFVLDSHTSYIAYRGTDNTLTGWKEDFMISFTRIPGQEEAAEYLRSVIRPFRKYYVGGHSKGGNLAMYACAHLPARLRSRILMLYNNDGPGFSPDTNELALLEPYSDRMIRLIPGFSVVGRIFEVPYGSTRIVAADENGLTQHDLINWQIRGRDPVYLDSTEEASNWMSETIDRWLENIPMEDRETFVEELFDVLSAGGAVTVQEVTGKGFMKVLQAAASASELSRRLVKELAETMIRTGSSQISGIIELSKIKIDERDVKE